MGEGKAAILRMERDSLEERSAETVRRIHQHVRAEVALNDTLVAALDAERAVSRAACERLRDLRNLLEEKQREIDGLLADSVNSARVEGER